MKLGDVAKHFESADAGPGSISSVADDPGGKSYGCYQLSKTTLSDYINKSDFQVRGSIGSEEFDKSWTGIAKEYPHEFELEQYLYILKYKYLPVVKFSKDVGYNTESRRIQEAIFSIAVQHGGARQIISKAYDPMLVSDEEVLSNLYHTRIEYVLGLTLSERLKTVLLKRYEAELLMILTWDRKVSEHVQ